MKKIENGMASNNLHKRINELEGELLERWSKKVSEKVNEALEGRDKCGVMVLNYIPNGTVSTIFIDTNNTFLRRINVYNHHVWDYLVNNLYLSKVKTVSVNADKRAVLYSEEDTLKFEDGFYKELDEIFEDDEYKELRTKVYDVKES